MPIRKVSSPRPPIPAQRLCPRCCYLPVRELPEGGLLAEVFDTTDGRRALLVYTALDRLLDACGKSQTWQLIETVALDAIQETQPFDIVAFDSELPQELLADGKIDVDLAGIKAQLNTFSYVVGDLEGALDGFPTAADAGEASDEIGAIVSALKSTSEYIVGAKKDWTNWWSTWRMTCLRATKKRRKPSLI